MTECHQTSKFIHIRAFEILFPISRHQNWNVSRILWCNLFNDVISLSISLNAFWLLLWKYAQAVINIRSCFADQPSCANRKVIDWRLPKFIHNSICFGYDRKWHLNLSIFAFIVTRWCVHGTAIDNFVLTNPTEEFDVALRKTRLFVDDKFESFLQLTFSGSDLKEFR